MVNFSCPVEKGDSCYVRKFFHCTQEIFIRINPYSCYSIMGISECLSSFFLIYMQNRKSFDGEKRQEYLEYKSV